MIKRVVVGIAAVLVMGTSHASTTTVEHTWDLGRGDGTSILDYYGSDSRIETSIGDLDLTITAWSSTGDGTCNTDSIECENGYARDDDPFIERAKLRQYGGGLGAVNNDEGDDTPNHALDNIKYSSSDSSNELDYDMVLLSFDEAVELTEVNIGWSYDNDITVLGYTGSDTLGANPFGNGDTKWSDLIASGGGWSSNVYADVGNGSELISQGYESRYWLVGVYNPVFGNTWSDSNDAVKLFSVTTQKTTPITQVSEPMTFALLIGGLGLMLRRRNR